MMALNMTCNMAFNMTSHMALNKTANVVTYEEAPVLSNGEWLLPPFLSEYFTEKTPDSLFEVDGYKLQRRDRTDHGGGIATFMRADIPARRRLDIEYIPRVRTSTYDVNLKVNMDFYYATRLTELGRIYTKPWRLPSTSCYFQKFVEFVMDGEWDSKHLEDIPGIGEVYAARMKTSLKGYCSVLQLFHMYLYWWRKGVPHYFFYLLHWATGADNNNGNMHIERAFQAFRQKHLLSLPSIVPWNVVDPHPSLPEIEYEDKSRHVQIDDHYPYLLKREYPDIPRFG